MCPKLPVTVFLNYSKATIKKTPSSNALTAVNPPINTAVTQWVLTGVPNVLGIFMGYQY